MSLPDDRNLFRHLGGVARGQDDLGLRVDEVPTEAAAQQGLCQQGIASEADLGVDLSVQPHLAAGALELSVERVLLFSFGKKLVLVSFDESKGQLGVHLFEHAHGARVAEWPQLH